MPALLLANLVAIGVGVLGLTALFVPRAIARLKARAPAVFWAAMVLAVLLQAPYLLGVAWGFGMQYIEEPTMGWVLVATFLLLPPIYFGMFLLSIGMQRRRLSGDPSFALALLATFLTAPLAHSTVVAVLSGWFGPP